MKNFIRVLLLLILLVQTLFSTNLVLTKKEKSYLKNHPILYVQGLESFPPFSFLENNKLKGYSVDYINLLSKYLGVKLEFVRGKNFSETIDMFNVGKIDILLHISRSEDREKNISFTDFNHIEVLIAETTRKNDNIKSFNDLHGKIIAVVKNTFIHIFLKENYPEQELLILNSPSDGVEAVSLNKADAFIGSKPTMDFYIHEKWLNNVYTRKLDGFDLNYKIFMPMGVKKDNKVLKSILEKANESIAYNEILKLKEKWLYTEDKIANDYFLNREELQYLDSKEVIKMCVIPYALPIDYIDKNGKHKGISADIIHIISKKINKKFVLVPTKTWKESLENIKQRKCDVLPSAIEDDTRKSFVNFTKPYIVEPYVVATRNGQFFIKDIYSLSDKKIGIIKDYAFIKTLKKINPSLKIIPVKNTNDGLKKVRSGELFAFIDILPTIGYYIQKYGYVDLKIAGKLDSNIRISIGSRNDEPLLNNILQKALSEISDEEKRKIVGKWIEIKVHQEFDYEGLFYVILFFTFVVLIILYNYRSIKRINRKLKKANIENQEQQKMVNKYVLMVNTDLDGNIIHVNDAYCKKIGYSKEELRKDSFTKIRHPDMKKEFFEELWNTIKKDRSWNGEIKNLNKKQEDVYFYLIIEPLYKDSKKLGYRAICEDISDKKRIEELSTTDTLTKLNNRLMIDEVLEKQTDIFYRYKTPFSIILFDLDDFKDVNDNYGHDVGDYVIKSVAKILKENVRKTDICGRWGGEEFIIICPNTHLSNSHILAENIRKLIEKFPFEIISKQTISIGVTEFRDFDTITTLFKRVDNLLYDAKRSGKNKTVKN